MQRGRGEIRNGMGGKKGAKKGGKQEKGRQGSGVGGEGRSPHVPIWALHHIEIVPH